MSSCERKPNPRKFKMEKWCLWNVRRLKLWQRWLCLKEELCLWAFQWYLEFKWRPKVTKCGNNSTTWFYFSIISHSVVLFCEQKYCFHSSSEQRESCN
jgi:hypothetical protein